MGQFPKLKKQAIIAMKGLPHTKRQEIGKSIAAWAECPIFRLEDSLDVLSREQGYALDNPPPDAEATRLQRLAFDLICRMAETQLRNYAKRNCVVISSPLSFGFHLDRLVQVSESVDEANPCRLLIIECQIKNDFQWRAYAEKELADPGRRVRWYEPRSWEDADKAIAEYGDEDWDTYYRKMAPPPRVKRLVVDPLEDLDMSEFIKRTTPNRRALFAEAMKHFLACGEDEDEESGAVVDYHLWVRHRLEQGISDAPRVDSCSPGDCVFYLTNKVQHDEGSGTNRCGVCEEQVAERAYLFRFGSLSFHESCATDIAKTKIWYSDQETCDELPRYGFRETHACRSHKTRKKRAGSFSYRCSSCIFQTHLKCRLMPTIVTHFGHEHVLSIRLLWTHRKKRKYRCKACWREGYVNSYCCNICRSDYHFSCLDRPLEMKHEHGGHLHRVKLEFSCLKEDEYEWCLVCYQDIDPQSWVYTCQDCDYVSHINCI